MNTTTSDYNGWSNRATWNANLWITNTEALYRTIGTIANTCSTVSEVADNMEGYMWILWKGKTPDGETLGMVNWVEIADAWIDAHGLDAGAFFKAVDDSL